MVLGSVLKELVGRVTNSNERELRKLQPVVQRINALEPDFERLTDAELRALTDKFKARLAAGETLDDLLPEAFAAVREAMKRTLGMRHFDVQLIGGIVLHQGKIAEMKTGEGKTMVAVLAAYLNSLTGRGVHIVTVNDYLAKRDAQWMGPIYHALGVSVASIQHEASYLFDPTYVPDDPRFNHLRPISRREAYLADVTYGTNNEFGFDYLRDNMAWDLSQCVQRELHYAIVDEVDNILIDEARTPLIISGPAEQSTDKYYLFARLVTRLRPNEDYVVDEKHRTVSLTETGIARVERMLGVDNLYDPENYELTRYLENALKAHALFKRDRDYVVKDGQVIIVDEFTGRLMFGRRYSEGLHQAIEAKEGVRIQRESVTLATITFQNYFRMYEKLAGMTGTAATEAEEFYKIYGLEVVVIPTNRPMIRMDYPDVIYKTEEAKFRAVVREIEELYQQGRPVLVGTVSIEKSERLSAMLKARGIPHQVLNAKYHEQEAYIVAQAGRPGMVTIATNMAGRGTDIILGGNPELLAREILKRGGIEFHKATPEQWEEAYAEAKKQWEADRQKVIELGGLHIIGTERHESRRIDNQLRGRAGRQGDPGSSRFYVSFEDDIIRRFGGDRIKGLMEWAGVSDDEPIESATVTKLIGQIQQKVEAYHFDIRKHLVEYDDVVNKHREVIYGERRKILAGADLRANILEMVHQTIDRLVDTYLPGHEPDDWDTAGLYREVSRVFPLPSEVTPNVLARQGREETRARLHEWAEKLYAEREAQFGAENMRLLERLVMLRAIDSLWVQHLTAMEEMREGIGLRAYAQTDPLVAYKREAHEMFQNLLAAIRSQVVHTIYHVAIQQAQPVPARPRNLVYAGGSATAASREPARVGSRQKVGRNDPCPCGSGKKYKKCHGRNA